MKKLVAVFTSKEELASFIVKGKACDFDAPFCGDSAFMVTFSIAVKPATDYIYSLADRLNGIIYDSFA